MRTLLTWLRSWRRPKSCESDTPTHAGSLHPGNVDEVQSYKSSGVRVCHKLQHLNSHSPSLLLADNHHHNHDSRLLKSCRVMPLPSSSDEDDIDRSDHFLEFDDDEDVDIEYSSMMRASFATVTSPLPDDTEEEDAHVSFSMPMMMPNRATGMQQCMSMPKLYSSALSSPARNMHLLPAENTPTYYSVTPEPSPAVHTKKRSRKMPLLFLRVLNRPPSPKRSPIPLSPSTNSGSPLPSNARLSDLLPSVPPSPLSQTKRTLKLPQSPSVRAMARTAATPPQSPLVKVPQQRLASPLQKVKEGKTGSPFPAMHSPSRKNAGASKTKQAPASTYQPLCCSSGKCILECHVVETSSKPDAQTNKITQLKIPTVYGMTILPSKDGSTVKHVRRMSFQNGRWITDDSDYVVLEL